LIAYAKANPGKVIRLAGAGGITHLACELLKAEAKIDVVHVPLQGRGAGRERSARGQVKMGIFDVPVGAAAHQVGEVQGAGGDERETRAVLPTFRPPPKSVIPRSSRTTGTVWSRPLAPRPLC